MSYTEIYGFDKDGNAYSQAEIKNAWRGAMAIWSVLEKRYLPPYRPSYVPEHIADDDIERFLGRRPTRTSSVMDDNAMKEIWGLFGNQNVSEVDRIVLGTTFDYVIVMKPDFDKLITAFESFEGETSLKEQAEVIKEMATDENCVAVGWNQTSINSDTWANFGGYDEETEESIPYNIFKPGNHWSLLSDVKTE